MKLEDGKIIVYRHRRASDNKVFYIGVGNSIRRAYVTAQRNNLWTKIYRKHGRVVEIIQICDDLETAYDLEMFLIEQYGRINNKTGILANLDDGGTGVTNRVITEEFKKKLSDTSTCKKEVHVYNMEGEYLTSYESVTECAKALGTTKSLLSECLCGRSRHTGGYRLSYDRNKDLLPIVTDKKSVYSETEDKTFESLTACAKYFGVDISKISNMVNNKISNSLKLSFV